MKNRTGFIKISSRLLLEADECLLEVFANFIPLIVEIKLRESIYKGYSPKFREVKGGEAIPEYDVIVARNEDEDISVEFNEISIEPTNNDIMNAMLNQVKEKHGTY